MYGKTVYRHFVKIQTNVNALFAQRVNGKNQGALSTSLQRLSSGLRINSAKDDAAGLAISERMTSQIKGLAVGKRNTNDGISMLQTAEGALAESTAMLQRMRELAVQAANTAVYGASERQKLQNELEQLTAEIDRISKTTEYNGVKILDGRGKAGAMDPESGVIDALRRGWLSSNVNTIERFMGLEAQSARLTVNLARTAPDSDGVNGTLAFVQVAAQNNLSLTIDMDDFSDPTLKNGGSPWLYNDRVLQHEMVHAVMGNTIASFNTLGVAVAGLEDTWFLEGTAELIHGGDERVANDGLAAAMADDLRAWDSNGNVSVDYSAGYLAVRYIHTKAGGYDPDNPTNSGIGQVLNELKNGSSLVNAINLATGENYADMDAFATDFQTNGQAYLLANGLDLGNEDTGAIGGTDAENGNTYRETTAETVVLDSNRFEENPTIWNVVMPQDAVYNEGASTNTFNVQVGATEGQVIQIGTVSAGATALGIDDVDLVSYAPLAIGTIDTAIDFLTKQRARLGAEMNRMQSAININETNIESMSAARSRIMDADFAVETSELTRTQIIEQASLAMISQAQAQPALVLSLLQ